MACKTVARLESFTQLGSLVSYNIFLSTLCPNRIGAVSQNQAIFHIHLKHFAVMMMIDDDDDNNNDNRNNSSTYDDGGGGGGGGCGDDDDDDDDDGRNSVLLCNSTFRVMDTATEYLLHMCVACVSLSCIVYMGTRKGAE